MESGVTRGRVYIESIVSASGFTLEGNSHKELAVQQWHDADGKSSGVEEKLLKAVALIAVEKTMADSLSEAPKIVKHHLHARRELILSGRA